jgi:hypothetical protein
LNLFFPLTSVGLVSFDGDNGSPLGPFSAVLNKTPVGVVLWLSDEVLNFLNSGFVRWSMDRF